MNERERERKKERERERVCLYKKALCIAELIADKHPSLSLLDILSREDLSVLLENIQSCAVLLISERESKGSLSLPPLTPALYREREREREFKRNILFRVSCITPVPRRVIFISYSSS
mmetsp:Transcript_39782/g.40555  ORF Transcript_39782/g.40555 Transcript_39782/m.40555 type:complete len:118 (+) Transcript_39782:341-694(+)